jgi:hypothetical protein
MYITRPFSFMGFDFLAEIEYRVTHWGCPAKTYGPPENCYPAEAPEWEVESIAIALDFPHQDYIWHTTTGALFTTLADHFAPAIEAAIDHAEPDIDWID